MTNLSNFARTGTSGATITTTDVGSGNKWDVVNTGGGTSTSQWDNSQSIHDGLSMTFATPVAATTAYVAWTTQAGSLTRCWGRTYVRLPTSPPTASSIVARFLAASSQKARIYVNTSGKLVMGDNTNANQGNTTATMPANTWFRVEWDITSGVSNAFEMRYFASAESYTPTETITGAASNFLAGNFDEVRFGTGASLASVVGYWIDDVNYNDIGFPGPSQLWTPPALIVTRPTHFLVPAGPLFVRATLADLPALATPGPVVVTSTPPAPMPVAPLIARSSLADVVVVASATPSPLVVTSTTPASLPARPTILRGALADAPPLTTPMPIVVLPAASTALPLAPVVIRGAPQNFATPVTTQPIVVAQPGSVSKLPSAAIVRRTSLQDFATPVTAGPLVVSQRIQSSVPQSPTILRNTLQDLSPAIRPLVATWRTRTDTPTPAIIVRGPALAVVGTPTPQPLVVTITYTPQVPARALLVRTLAGDVEPECTVTRPFTGILARPSAGLVLRPDSGAVARPGVGTVVRPDIGTVDRPGCGH